MPLQMCKGHLSISLTQSEALVSFKGASPRTALTGVILRSSIMRSFAAALSLGVLLAASGAPAQTNPQTTVINSTQRLEEATSPDYTAVYCSSFVTDEKLPTDTLLISGQESNVKVIFARGDYVYVNKGSAQG